MAGVAQACVQCWLGAARACVMIMDSRAADPSAQEAWVKEEL